MPDNRGVWETRGLSTGVSRKRQRNIRIAIVVMVCSAIGVAVNIVRGWM